MQPTSPNSKTIALTTLAMIAFAANTLLCRMALGEGVIDAASFTLIRLDSGALVLLPLVLLARRAPTPARPDWIAPVAMSVSMICFSFAYLALGYVIWYHALPGLTATSAATVQLSISVLAATGGAFLFAEAFTARLIGSSAAMLGGLALVFRQQGAARSPAPIHEGCTQVLRPGASGGRPGPRRRPPRRSSTPALRPEPIG
jgi:drug/metabolite transporter (DMT)-like permease